jgi:sulfotransferase
LKRKVFPIRPIHFISGLPRSGSTLLSALLRQNPRFHAGMSGPVAGLLNSLLGEMSAANEYSVFLSDEQRKRILLGVVENYYGAEYPADIIFDTNRLWCARMPLLNSLFPESKVIACVRDMPWIIDSIERLVRRNALSPSSIFQYQSGGTVYTRADTIANGDGLAGFAYNGLKEAFYGEHTRQLMLVQYETLVTAPERVMNAIYAFIGEPHYQHDFDNVAYEAEEFDARAGTPGLHVVRAKVGASPRQTILPPDVFRRFENDAFWRNPQLNTHGVQIV